MVFDPRDKQLEVSFNLETNKAQQNIESITEGFENLNSSVSPINDSFGQLDGKIGTLKNSIVGLTKTQSNLKDSFLSFVTGFDQMGFDKPAMEVAKLEQAIESIDNRAPSLIGKVTGIDKKFDNLADTLFDVQKPMKEIVSKDGFFLRVQESIQQLNKNDFLEKILKNGSKQVTEIADSLAKLGGEFNPIVNFLDDVSDKLKKGGTIVDIIDKLEDFKDLMKEVRLAIGTIVPMVGQAAMVAKSFLIDGEGIAGVINKVNATVWVLNRTLFKTEKLAGSVWHKFSLGLEQANLTMYATIATLAGKLIPIAQELIKVTSGFYEGIESLQMAGIDTTLIQMAEAMGTFGEGLLNNTQLMQQFTQISLELSTELKEVGNYIQTLGAESTQDISKISGALRELSSELGNAVFSAELGASLYNNLSAGIGTATGQLDEAVKVSEAAAKFAIATQGNIASVQEATIFAMQTYKKSAQETVTLFDALVKQGITNTEQLQASVGRLTAVGSAAGISMEELFRSTALATKTLGADAYIAIERLALSLGDLTPQAEKTLKKYNITAKQIGDILKDPDKGIFGVIELLRKAGITSAQALGEIIPESVALRGALALLSQDAQTAADSLEAIKGADFENIEESFSKTQETVQAKGKAITNLIKEIFAEAGAELDAEGLFNKGIGALDAMAKNLENNKDIFKNIAKFVLRFQQALKKTWQIIGLVTKAIGVGLSVAFSIFFFKILSRGIPMLKGLAAGFFNAKKGATVLDQVMAALEGAMRGFLGMSTETTDAMGSQASMSNTLFVANSKLKFSFEKLKNSISDLGKKWNQIKTRMKAGIDSIRADGIKLSFQKLGNFISKQFWIIVSQVLSGSLTGIKLIKLGIKGLVVVMKSIMSVLAALAPMLLLTAAISAITNLWQKNQDYNKSLEKTREKIDAQIKSLKLLEDVTLSYYAKANLEQKKLLENFETELLIRDDESLLQRFGSSRVWGRITRTTKLMKDMKIVREELNTALDDAGENPVVNIEDLDNIEAINDSLKAYHDRMDVLAGDKKTINQTFDAWVLVDGAIKDGTVSTEELNIAVDALMEAELAVAKLQKENKDEYNRQKLTETKEMQQEAARLFEALKQSRDLTDLYTSSLLDMSDVGVATMAKLTHGTGKQQAAVDALIKAKQRLFESSTEELTEDEWKEVERLNKALNAAKDSLKEQGKEKQKYIDTVTKLQDSTAELTQTELQYIAAQKESQAQEGEKRLQNELKVLQDMDAVQRQIYDRENEMPYAEALALAEQRLTDFQKTTKKALEFEAQLLKIRENMLVSAADIMGTYNDLFDENITLQGTFGQMLEEINENLAMDDIVPDHREMLEIRKESLLVTQQQVLALAEEGIAYQKLNESNAVAIGKTNKALQGARLETEKVIQALASGTDGFTLENLQQAVIAETEAWGKYSGAVEDAIVGEKGINNLLTQVVDFEDAQGNRISTQLQNLFDPETIREFYATTVLNMKEEVFAQSIRDEEVFLKEQEALLERGEQSQLEYLQATNEIRQQILDEELAMKRETLSQLLSEGNLLENSETIQKLQDEILALETKAIKNRRDAVTNEIQAALDEQLDIYDTFNLEIENQLLAGVVTREEYEQKIRKIEKDALQARMAAIDEELAVEDLSIERFEELQKEKLKLAIEFQKLTAKQMAEEYNKELETVMLEGDTAIREKQSKLNLNQLIIRETEVENSLKSIRLNIVKEEVKMEIERLNTQLKSTNDLTDRAALQTKIVEEQIELQQKEIDFEVESLELQLESNELQLERKEIEIEIEKIRLNQSKLEKESQIRLAQLNNESQNTIARLNLELQTIEDQITLNEQSIELQEKENELTREQTESQLEILQQRRELVSENGAIELEIAKNNEIIAQYEEQLKRLEVKNASEELHYNSILNTVDNISKAYDNQASLLTAQQSNVTNLTDNYNKLGEMISGMSASEITKYEIERETAKLRVKTVKRQQEIEKKLFEFSQMQEKIAARRLVIESQIAEQKAKMVLLEAQAEAQATLARRDATEEEKALALIKVKSAAQALDLQKNATTLAQGNLEIQEEVGEINKEVFDRNQRMEKLDAKIAELGSITGDTASGEMFDLLENARKKEKKALNTEFADLREFGDKLDFSKMENSISDLDKMIQDNMNPEKTAKAMKTALTDESVLFNMPVENPISTSITGSVDSLKMDMKTVQESFATKINNKLDQIYNRMLELRPTIPAVGGEIERGRGLVVEAININLDGAANLDEEELANKIVEVMNTELLETSNEIIRRL